MDKLVTLAGRSEKGVFSFVIDAERQHLEKTAAEYHPTIASYINQARPIPGRTQILLTALGAGEYWGNNANGDFFPESALAHEGSDYGYKTFEEFARVYKHHCFVAGTLVNTDTGLVPIEDIRIGSVVVTHNGRLREVKDTFAHDYKGTMCCLGIQGLGVPIEVTEEHRFQVVRRTSLSCPKHRNSGRNFCTFFRNVSAETCAICGRSRALPEVEWVNANDIKVGDYLVCTPAPVEPSVDVARSKALGTLAGFYLADGSFYKDKKNKERAGVTITFHRDRLTVHEKLKSAAEYLGLTVMGPYIHKVNRTANFVIKGHDFANKIFAWCGEYSHTKKIDASLIGDLGAEGCKAFLGAYVDGDGSVAKSCGIVRIRSCNRNVLLATRDLFLRLGIPATYNFDSPRPQSNGLVKNTTPSGIVQISAGSAEALADVSLRIKESPFVAAKAGSKMLNVAGKWLQRVAAVSSTDAKVQVYNLEVEEDNSYQVLGINTHNCNKDPNNSYGNVALSVYNPVFHRVELIISLDNDAAPDIVEKHEKGEQISWSMGCRVGFDVCSVCGNRAPTRLQYCDHCRYHLGRIDPESGKLVYVINPKPRFFDISYVLIGADRIAKTLRKVASYGSAERVIGSAEAAEKMAATLKAATIEKEVTTADPPGSSQLASAVAQAVTELKSREEPLPRQTLNQLGRFPLKNALSTLAMLGILPKPQEFQRIVLVSLGKEDVADELDSCNCAFDPAGVAPAPQSVEDAMGISSRNFSPDVMQALRPFMAERSNVSTHLGPRLVVMMKRASKKQRLPTLLKVGNDAPRTSLTKFASVLSLTAAMYATFEKRASAEAVAGIDRLLTEHPTLAAALGLTLLSMFRHGLAIGGARQMMGDYTPTRQYADSDASRVFSRIEELKQKPYMKVASHRTSTPAQGLYLGMPAVFMASGSLQKQRENSPHDVKLAADAFVARRPDVMSGLCAADALLAVEGVKTASPYQRALAVAHRGLPKGTFDFHKVASAQDFLEAEILDCPREVKGALFDQAALETSLKVLGGSK